MPTPLTQKARTAIAKSTLWAANGVSRQELIRSIPDVLSLIQQEHISDALFRPWAKSYQVPDELRKSLNLGTRKPTLRLDPADERLYALRATNPTPPSSEYKTELGAQALAVPAFELLPVCPMHRPICIASRARGARTASSSSGASGALQRRLQASAVCLLLVRAM